MNPAALRIQHLTAEIQSIQNELQNAIDRGIPETPDGPLLDEVLNYQLIQELKRAVDQMRMFLWAYIEVAARRRGRDVNYELQAFRLQRIADILRAIDSEHPKQVSPIRQGFVERVTELISNYDLSSPSPDGGKPKAA